MDPGGRFALDWYFRRNVDFLQRVVLLGFAAAGVGWVFVRFALPWLGKREDETDMALLVSGKRASTATWWPPCNSNRPLPRSGARRSWKRP